MTIDLQWRGAFASAEVENLHGGAVDVARVLRDERRDLRRLVAAHSLGWVTARRAGWLVGFVNVPWDGRLHAWIVDVVVDVSLRRLGVGRRLVAAATEGARAAGCEWLHVDFEERLRPFYLDACGFTPSAAGLLRLRA
ncbi:MAG: GNAT family N-acetyltransferase [Kineosporiaceae bacterium]